MNKGATGDECVERNPKGCRSAHRAVTDAWRLSKLAAVGTYERREDEGDAFQR
jgi:hypothetical protein